MTNRVKICGVKTPADIDACAQAGAAYLGFNFFAKSPRSVSLDQARDLAWRVPVGMARVGLIVNMDDASISRLTEEVPLDILQLHGGESLERVAQVKAMTGLPVMKVVGVASADDLPKLDQFSDVADMILVDAKAPKGAILPGGNGVRFDWTLIAGREWSVPWMLAGGLTPNNVAEAIAKTGARQVDVASGVESAPGQKDAAMIQDFVTAAG